METITVDQLVRLVERASALMGALYALDIGPADDTWRVYVINSDESRSLFLSGSLTSVYKQLHAYCQGFERARYIPGRV